MIFWIFPNKTKRHTGIFKYNYELQKIVKEKKIIQNYYAGVRANYTSTFFYKFIYLPIFLIFNSHKFDAVIYPEEGFAFLRLFSFSKKNKLIIHDYRKAFNIKYKIKINEKFKQIYLNFNFLFINQFNKIIVPSEFTKKLLMTNEKIKSKKILKIPNIINFSFGNKTTDKKNFVLKKISKKKNNVMCITSKESRKNSSFIYKIAKITKNINFFIVGDIVGNNNHKNIYNFKNLSEKNLIYIFKKSDLFLDVSLFEGFGRSVIEAQHYGIKILCFNTEINKEILTKSAILIKKNTSLKIISKILKKEVLKKNKKKNNYVFNYSQKKIKENFKKQINEI